MNATESSFAGLGYRLEKQDEPGIAIDLDSPLSTLDTLEFCLVRENSELYITFLEPLYIITQGLKKISKLQNNLNQYKSQTTISQVFVKIQK